MIDDGREVVCLRRTIRPRSLECVTSATSIIEDDASGSQPHPGDVDKALDVLGL